MANVGELYGVVIVALITAARPAYAGTEGCYILRLFFFFFFI